MNAAFFVVINRRRCGKMFTFLSSFETERKSSSSFFVWKKRWTWKKKAKKKKQIHDSRLFMHVWEHFISTNIHEILFILFALKFFLLCLNSNGSSVRHRRRRHRHRCIHARKYKQPNELKFVCESCAKSTFYWYYSIPFGTVPVLFNQFIQYFATWVSLASQRWLMWSTRFQFANWHREK